MTDKRRIEICWDDNTGELLKVGDAIKWKLSGDRLLRDDLMVGTFEEDSPLLSEDAYMARKWYSQMRRERLERERKLRSK